MPAVDAASSAGGGRYFMGTPIGSASGAPNTRGYILELNYLPWLNTKLQAQYVGYERFDGGSTNYDGSGRSASDNNTLYVLAWLAF